MQQLVKNLDFKVAACSVVEHGAIIELVTAAAMSGGAGFLTKISASVGYQNTAFMMLSVASYAALNGWIIGRHALSRVRSNYRKLKSGLSLSIFILMVVKISYNYLLTSRI